jgi:CCR4-NOT transcription complex subunit 7/8
MPPVGRYGPSGTPFSMLQQPHMQQHPQSQQHHHSQAHNSGLPLSGVNAGFSPGNPNANSNLNPFTISNTPGGLNGGLSGVGGGDGGGGGLGAQAHQGFMRGAQMQQQQQQMAHEAMGNPGTPRKGLNSRFRDVWKHNLAQEMQVLRGLVEKYPYISMVSSAVSHRRRQMC